MKVFGIDVGQALTAVAITAAIIYTGGAAAAAMSVGTAVTISAALGQAALMVGGGLILQKLQGKNSVGDPGRLVTQRNPTETRKVVYGRSRVSGTIISMGTSSTNKDDNKFLHMYIALAAHEVEDIEAVYFDEEKVWYDSAGSKVYNQSSSYWDSSDGIIYYIDHRLGGSDNSTYIAPNTDNNLGTFETGDTDLTAEWTSNHKLTDVAYIYVRLRFDANFFPNGLPNITAVVKGKKLYDPSDASTTFSSNPALCILDYLRDDYYGLNISNDEIDLTSFSSAATICDQLIALDAGGTEPQYTCNGIIDLSRKPSEVLADLLTACAGDLFYTNGKFVIKAGAYESPTISLDESNILGSITATTKPSVRDGYNGVKGLYAEPNLLWRPLEYPVLKSSSYATIDGYENFLTHDLNYTTSGTMAQRLSKIALNKSRQEVSIQFQTDLKGLQLSVGDTFNLTSEKLGYTNKVFQIREMNIEFSPVLGVTISAIEISSATYNWQASEEQAIIEETAFYEGETSFNAPTNLSVTSSAVINTDGTIQAKWAITFDESTTRSVHFYELQWKLSTDSVYQSASIGNVSEFEGVGSVVPGLQYNVRLRAVFQGGATSTFVTATHVMAGDSSAPDAPEGLTATGGIESITLDWDGNTETDLRGYYLYENTVNNSATATQRGFVSADLFTRTNLPSSATRYYWVSAVDYSGNESAKSTVASATTDASITGDDTKTASGYVYYQTASSSQPSSPSASSFSFSTLQFSGLSSSWDESPPQISDNADRYWASQYIVEDVDGTQTITFATPFRSFYFDGLVTFTNLNNELADPTSSEITTISGGLIKTGTVDADRIQLDGNTIEASASGIKIKNLGVDTLQIADNAVTVPDATFSDTSVSITTSTSPHYYVVLELSVASIADTPNLITFSVHAYTNTKEQFIAGVGVTRNGVDDFLLEFGQLTNNTLNEIVPGTTVAGSVIHTPTTSGTDVYKIYLAHNQTGKILRANARSLSRLTVKK